MKILQDDLQCSDDSNDFNDFNDSMTSSHCHRHRRLPLEATDASLRKMCQCFGLQVERTTEPHNGLMDEKDERVVYQFVFDACLFWSFVFRKGKNLAPDWEKESEDLGFKFGFGPGVYQGHVFFSHIDYIHPCLLIWWMTWCLISRVSVEFKDASGEACEWSTLRSSSTASTVIAVGTCSSWIVSIHARQKEYRIWGCFKY